MSDDSEVPDLQSATGVAPQQPLSQASLISALQGPSVSPMLAGASGMLNTLGGGRPGANPYLASNMAGQEQINRVGMQAGQMQQQEAQFQQQQMIRAQHLQQRVNEMKLKGQHDILGVATTLLNHDSEEARLTGGKMMAQTLKEMGRPEAMPIIKALGTRKATPADLNEAYRDVLRGLPPDVVSRRHPNLDVDTLKAVYATKDHDDVRKMAGLKTKGELAKDDIEARLKQADLMAKQYPEMAGNAKEQLSLNMTHRRLFDNKDYVEGDKGTQLRAYQVWERDQRAEEDRKAQLAGKTQADMLARIAAQGQNQIAGVLARTGAQANKPPTTAEMTRARKVTDVYQKQSDVLSSIQRLDGLADQMDKLGALPTGEDVASQLWAKAKRTTAMRSNPTIFTFQQLWAPISIGQIDRGMFDEKGVRAISAFAKQIDAVDNMPTKAAIKSYTQAVREHILRKMNEDIKVMEKLGERQEIVDVARDIYGQWEPKARAAQPGPLKPTLPPGAKLEGGDIVSESGKFIWRDMRWQPR